MDYKVVLLRLKNMVLSPAKEWEEIKSGVTNNTDSINFFAIPIIGLLALASFLGVLLNNQGINFQYALVEAIVTFTSAYFSIYVAAFAIGELSSTLGIAKDRQQIMKFLPYAYSAYYIIVLVTELIPELFFIKILVLYSFYLVWEQSSVIYAIAENDRVKFTVIYTLILLIIPGVLGWFMKFLVQNISL